VAWATLKSDPDTFLRTFIEEVLRLESPVQALFRVARRDIEMHGVTIPAGAVINTRYAAANRDERHFPDPEKLDLTRRNAASHLAFGSGVHHCLGAPLARRELYWGFRAFIDRVEDFELAPERNTLRHAPNFALRALKELHITFTKRG
jgi:cytochrome P450